jgi:hypothetical protein
MVNSPRPVTSALAGGLEAKTKGPIAAKRSRQLRIVVSIPRGHGFFLSAPVNLLGDFVGER